MASVHSQQVWGGGEMIGPQLLVRHLQEEGGRG